MSNFERYLDLTEGVDEWEMDSLNALIVQEAAKAAPGILWEVIIKTAIRRLGEDPWATPSDEGQ